MNSKLLQSYFLAALIAISFTLTFFIFKPFLIILVLATVFAVVLHPFYRIILRRMDNSPGLAAFVTLCISLVVILVPLTILTMQISGDAQRLYTSLADGSGKASLDAVFKYGNDTVTRFAPNLALSSAELSASIDQYLKDGLTWLIQSLGSVFGSAAHLLLSFFLFLVALYYLLRDGAKLKKTIVEASPLGDTEDRLVFDRLELAIHSLIRGSLMIAFIQGTLTGIGFAIFGVPNSILWGMLAAFAALIPGIGTSLVLIPGVLYLFIIGSVPAAFGLLIWGAVAVGMIDNFLGPKLIGKGMQLHPLVVLLSIFGGLALFGPAGVFLGPLSISLLFALLSIYRTIRNQ